MSEGNGKEEERPELTLYPHQVKPYKRLKAMLEKRSRVILSLDRGFGKTFLALYYIKESLERQDIGDPSDRCFLIAVKSANIIDPWKTQLDKYLSDKEVLVYHGQGRDRHIRLNRYQIILTSYQIIQRELEKFRKTVFSAVIIDEVHNLTGVLGEEEEIKLFLRQHGKLVPAGSLVFSKSFRKSKNILETLEWLVSADNSPLQYAKLEPDESSREDDTQKPDREQLVVCFRRLRTGVLVGLTGTAIQNSVGQFDRLLSLFLSTKGLQELALESRVKEINVDYMKLESEALSQEEKQIVAEELVEKERSLRKAILSFTIHYTNDQIPTLDPGYTILPRKDYDIVFPLLTEHRQLIREMEKAKKKKTRPISAALMKKALLCPQELEEHLAEYQTKTIVLKALLKVIPVTDKTVVFSSSVIALRNIQRHLYNDHYFSYLITGDDPLELRAEKVRAFGASRKSRILLASLNAMGEGIDLTSANHVVIFDYWWNPQKMLQATDRCHRTGQQKKCVFVYWLKAAIQMEDYLRKVIEDKLRVERLLFGGESTKHIRIPLNRDFSYCEETISSYLRCLPLRFSKSNNPDELTIFDKRGKIQRTFRGEKADLMHIRWKENAPYNARIRRTAEKWFSQFPEVSSKGFYALSNESFEIPAGEAGNGIFRFDSKAFLHAIQLSPQELFNALFQKFGYNPYLSIEYTAEEIKITCYCGTPFSLPLISRGLSPEWFEVFVSFDNSEYEPYHLCPNCLKTLEVQKTADNEYLIRNNAYRALYISHVFKPDLSGNCFYVVEDQYSKKLFYPNGTVNIQRGPYMVQQSTYEQFVKECRDRGLLNLT